ncbi:hypothetical protein BgiMline_023659 [Biomphalaria glabrata]|uniref:Uncharacterized protein LOC129928860 n=1 Tax=Biomphalaria glabrata TaxID=6526 RepID=A0A9W3BNY2_BIOGL|nr:uncharacterized protein LOC129928860 [Biomphalaria glabrata]KAI8759752.1 hypothetical protein BgiMline_006905 [Biomphalaria glabrata]
MRFNLTRKNKKNGNRSVYVPKDRKSFLKKKNIKAKLKHFVKSVKAKEEKSSIERINFLHGLDRILYHTTLFCQTVVKEQMITCLSFMPRDEFKRRLRQKFREEFKAMRVMNDVIQCAHLGQKPFSCPMSYEAYPDIVQRLDEVMVKTKCPCNDPTNKTYLDPQAKLLAEDNIGGKFKSERERERLENQRKFVQAIQSIEAITAHFLKLQTNTQQD